MRRRQRFIPRAKFNTPAAMVQAGNMSKHVYNSLGEFIEAAESNPHPMTLSSSWAGVQTLPEATHLARFGWSEGLSKVNRIAERIEARVTSLIEIPQVTYDVTGLDYDIGLVTQGIPESWYSFQTMTQEGTGFRHVRVVVNFAVSGGIQAPIIENRGAICAALVMSLEAAGIRVTLDAVCAVSGDKECWINLKHSDQPLDVDRLAFALVHPAMLRHLLLNAKPWHSRAPRETSDQGDIYINSAMFGESQWSDETKASEWIINQLKIQGVHIHE